MGLSNLSDPRERHRFVDPGLCVEWFVCGSCKSMSKACGTTTLAHAGGVLRITFFPPAFSTLACHTMAGNRAIHRVSRVDNPTSPSVAGYFRIGRHHSGLLPTYAGMPVIYQEPSTVATTGLMVRWDGRIFS
jgi:hypothetical protein